MTLGQRTCSRRGTTAHMGFLQPLRDKKRPLRNAKMLSREREVGQVPRRRPLPLHESRDTVPALRPWRAPGARPRHLPFGRRQRAGAREDGAAPVSRTEAAGAATPAAFISAGRTALPRMSPTHRTSQSCASLRLCPCRAFELDRPQLPAGPQCHTPHCPPPKFAEETNR